jgi:DNA-binding beta-propeller fold protein YncE
MKTLSNGGRSAIVITVLLSFVILSRTNVAGESASLTLTRTIPLSGVIGRFDHFSIDVARHRLFVAALGNNTLEVLDTEAGKRIQSIGGLHKPCGVLYLPAENQIAVANGDSGVLALFDGTSCKLLKKIGLLEDADNVRYDAKSRLIWVGYADGALALIDAAAGKQAGTIRLPAHPESFQMEQQGSRVFVNVPDAKQIVVIERNTRSITETWPMREFQANFPMALDEANKRLFVGCRSPAQLIVFNTITGKPTANIAISEDTDDLFYDGALKRIYVSCGGGFVDVIDQRGADEYQLRERIPTRPGARTSFFSPALNQFYLAVPKRGKESAEIRIFRPVK